jgi:hypothetical protein
MSLARVGFVAAALVPLLAAAQDRDESSMFGGGDEVADAGVKVEASNVAAEVADGGAVEAQSRDSEQLGGREIKNQFDTGDQKSDWLKIGGTLYERAIVSWNQDPTTDGSNGPDTFALSAPSLLDVYLDARPNDRVRGFALGRLRYDPTLSASSSSTLVPTAGGATVSNPSVSLDQLWLRFDVLRKVYLTVGRQKVKWGTGRIWNPTDFLNSQKRDPLAPFDLRLGINAVKVHVPIESLGWNFYGFGLLDNNGPANLVGDLGGALRGEILLGPAEIGFAGVWVKGRRPRYAVDASAPIGPLDFYGEVAFRSGRDFTAYDLTGKDPATTPPQDLFVQRQLDQYVIQSTLGVAYSVNYTESNTLTVGAEYFYNGAGASNPALYLPLIYSGTYTPFYAGQHYLGVFAVAPGLPNYNWITLNLAGLLNVSDPSGIIRLDAYFRVLTFLQVEAFAAVNFGVKGGEFHFGGAFPEVPTAAGPVGPFTVPYPVGSAGVGLRLSI